MAGAVRWAFEPVTAAPTTHTTPRMAAEAYAFAVSFLVVLLVLIAFGGNTT